MVALTATLSVNERSFSTVLTIVVTPLMPASMPVSGFSNNLVMLRLNPAWVSSALIAPNAVGETIPATLALAAAPPRAAWTAEDERMTSASPSFA